MALRQSMESSGVWLFRWRSYLPLALLVPVLWALALPSPWPGGGLPFWWQLLCFGVSLLGLVIRVWAVGHAPHGTSGRNTRAQVADELNTTGIYSVVRHPLYLGNYLMWLGVAMLPGSIAVVTIVSLAFWVYYERIMLAEEAFLRERFGATFERWAERTPAFLPATRGFVPARLPFSARSVLRREYSGLAALTTLFPLFVALKDLFRFRHVQTHPFWWAVLAIGAVTYLVLRTLKRRTKVLDVSGR